MKPYKHFTTEERKCLQQFLSEGLSFRQIADLLERSPSTISREVNRNKAKYRSVSGIFLFHTGEKRAVKSNSSRHYITSKAKSDPSPDRIL